MVFLANLHCAILAVTLVCGRVVIGGIDLDQILVENENGNGNGNGNGDGDGNGADYITKAVADAVKMADAGHDISDSMRHLVVAISETDDHDEFDGQSNDGDSEMLKRRKRSVPVPVPVSIDQLPNHVGDSARAALEAFSNWKREYERQVASNKFAACLNSTTNCSSPEILFQKRLAAETIRYKQMLEVTRQRNNSFGFKTHQLAIEPSLTVQFNRTNVFNLSRILSQLHMHHGCYGNQTLYRLTNLSDSTLYRTLLLLNVTKATEMDVNKLNRSLLDSVASVSLPDCSDLPFFTVVGATRRSSEWQAWFSFAKRLMKMSTPRFPQAITAYEMALGLGAKMDNTLVEFLEAATHPDYLAQVALAQTAMKMNSTGQAAADLYRQLHMWLMVSRALSDALRLTNSSYKINSTAGAICLARREALLFNEFHMGNFLAADHLAFNASAIAVAMRLADWSIKIANTSNEPGANMIKYKSLTRLTASLLKKSQLRDFLNDFFACCVFDALPAAKQPPKFLVDTSMVKSIVMSIVRQNSTNLTSIILGSESEPLRLESSLSYVCTREVAFSSHLTLMRMLSIKPTDFPGFGFACGFFNSYFATNLTQFQSGMAMLSEAHWSNFSWQASSNFTAVALNLLVRKLGPFPVRYMTKDEFTTMLPQWSARISFLSPQRIRPNSVRLLESVPRLALLHQFETTVTNNVQTRKIWTSKEAAIAYFNIKDLGAFPPEVASAALASARWCIHALMNNQRNMTQAEKFATTKLAFMSLDNAIDISQRSLPISERFDISRSAYHLGEAACLLGLNCTEVEVHKIIGFKSLADDAWMAAPGLMPCHGALSEAIICHMLWTNTHDSYLRVLDRERPTQRSITDRGLKYLHFVNEMTVGSSRNATEHRRQSAVMSILQEEGRSVTVIGLDMRSPYMQYDAAGFINGTTMPVFDPALPKFSSIAGVKVSKSDGSITLLVTPTADHRSTLFTASDISDIFAEDFRSCNSSSLYFSLDDANERLPLFPFNKFRYSSSYLRETGVLTAMFHTDYLLKFLSLNAEISVKPPFAVRPLAPGSYLHQMMQTFQLPLTQQNSSSSSLSRLWIAADQMKIDWTESESDVTIALGDVRMMIKTKQMAVDSSGQSHDIDASNPEKLAFTNRFTAQYDRIAETLIEFKRLKELTKLFEVRNALCGLVRSLASAQADHSVSQSARDRASRFRADLLAQIGLMTGMVKSKRVANSSVSQAEERPEWVPAVAVKTVIGDATSTVFGGVSLSPHWQRYQSLADELTRPIRLNPYSYFLRSDLESELNRRERIISDMQAELNRLKAQSEARASALEAKAHEERMKKLSEAEALKNKQKEFKDREKEEQKKLREWKPFEWTPNGPPYIGMTLDRHEYNRFKESQRETYERDMKWYQMQSQEAARAAEALRDIENKKVLRAQPYSRGLVSDIYDTIGDWRNYRDKFYLPPLYHSGIAFQVDIGNGKTEWYYMDKLGHGRTPGSSLLNDLRGVEDVPRLMKGLPNDFGLSMEPHGPEYKDNKNTVGDYYRAMGGADAKYDVRSNNCHDGVENVIKIIEK